MSPTFSTAAGAEEEAAPPSALKNMPRIRTVSTGPIEQSEIRPKLSSWEPASPRTAATPSPSARMNGTVIGPVVTPPESNATARKSGEVNAAIAKRLT